MIKMKKSAHIIFVLALVLSLMVGASVIVLADWEEGYDYKMHYPQFPDDDMFPLALDCTGLLLAADDFECTESGPITDIHVWGSWESDEVDEEAEFEVCIWLNDPEPPGDWSVPEEEPEWCWVFGPEDYTLNEWEELDGDGFFGHPMTGEGYFTQIYQYNFLIDVEDAFVQQAGTIYWLSVTCISDEDYWGWNTTYPGYPPEGCQWNDDAVWWYFGEDEWIELLYPYIGESADFAFVITGPSPPEPSAPSQPSGEAVGGDVFPADKVSLIAPWLGLAAIILAGGIFLIRRRVHS